jgi:hypothetical protein
MAAAVCSPIAAAYSPTACPIDEADACYPTACPIADAVSQLLKK